MGLTSKIECLGDDVRLLAVGRGKITLQQLLESFIYHFFVINFSWRFFVREFRFIHIIFCCWLGCVVATKVQYAEKYYRRRDFPEDFPLLPEDLELRP